MAKKTSVSSQPEKLRRVRNEDIALSDQAKAQLAALEERPVDVTDPDAPEVTDWSTAERGKFYRPIKQQITIRLDRNVLAWFRRQPGRYQTLINQACREYMEQHEK